MRATSCPSNFSRDSIAGFQKIFIIRSRFLSVGATVKITENEFTTERVLLEPAKTRSNGFKNGKRNVNFRDTYCSQISRHYNRNLDSSRFRLSSFYTVAANAEYIKMADHYVPVPGGTNNNNYANVELIVDLALRAQVQVIYQRHRTRGCA